MTRKDYINIAAAILATQTRIKGDFERKQRDQFRNVIKYDGLDLLDIQRDNQLRGVRRTAAHLADFLKDDNPQHFDPAMFLRNCGYSGVERFVTDVASSEEAGAQQENTASDRRFGNTYSG